MFSRDARYSSSCKLLLRTEWRLGMMCIGKRDVLYQLCHFSSKRLEEKWHNWYSTSRFPLQNIGFLKGAHPIAAELTTCGLPGVEP